MSWTDTSSCWASNVRLAAPRQRRKLNCKSLLSPLAEEEEEEEERRVRPPSPKEETRHTDDALNPKLAIRLVRGHGGRMSEPQPS